MRRGNGDGSIFKLSGKRRKPYAVRVTVEWTDDGKQKYKYIGYYENKTAAKKALNEYLAAPEKIKLEKHTLKSVFNNMIDKSKFSDGTIKQYISGFNQFPQLHNRNIDSIELYELENVLTDKSPSTQSRIKKTLSNCYKYAMKHDYINKNLADYLDAETQKAKEKDIFTFAEIATLWDNVNGGKFNDIPIILLYTGLRISELLNMKTDDVNIEDKKLSVTTSKTAAGVRVVPIHDKILPLIKSRYSAANSHLITHNNKNVPYSTFAREHWKQQHTIHETRHTFITQLSKSVTDQLAIKKIVGHAAGDITQHYTHHSHDELLAVINKLEYK